MLLTDEDQASLKAWVHRRLEKVPWPEDDNVDLDVLADYVTLLVGYDLEFEEVKKLCLEELPEIVPPESVPVFVNDLFHVLWHRSYVPGAPPPSRRAQALATPRATQPSTRAPTAKSADIYQKSRQDKRPNQPIKTENGQPFGLRPFGLPEKPLAAAQDGMPSNNSRKRSYNERDDPSSTPSEQFGRPKKWARGNRGRGGGRDANQDGVSEPLQPSALSFDPATFMPFPEMMAPQPFLNWGVNNGRKPCKWWQKQGYCTRGAECKFAHDVPAFLPGLPYNGSFSPLPSFGLSDLNAMPPGNGGLGFPHGTQPQPFQQRTQNNAALTPVQGPVMDKTKSTIMVQSIPPENFSEDQVLALFSEFGHVTELSLHSFKRSAKIKFDSWAAANAAYRSPKVMFDNRFVKVFWLKEDESNGFPATKNGISGDSTKRSTNGHTNGSDIKMPDADDAQTSEYEPEFDMKEFMEKQRVAQQLYDERLAKKQLLKQRQAELHQRQAQLNAKHAEEKQKLRAKLGDSVDDDATSSRSVSPEILLKREPGTSAKASSPTPQTEAIRAQLAALEREAAELGININEPEAAPVFYAPRGRGRGAPRGRGSRGGSTLNISERHSAYAAYSLDNRSKKIMLSGTNFGDPHNEMALREYLLLHEGFTDIVADLKFAIVSFSDRRAAEKFYSVLTTSKSIPGVDGQIELKWITGSVPTPVRFATAAAAPAIKTESADGTLTPKEMLVDSKNPSAAMRAGQNDDEEEEGEIIEDDDYNFDVANGW